MTTLTLEVLTRAHGSRFWVTIAQSSAACISSFKIVTFYTHGDDAPYTSVRFV